MPPTEESPRPTDRDLARKVDAVIATKPDVDADRCTEALAALCRARDGMIDDAHRDGINLLISLVMAVKHPLATPPWDEIADARRAVLPA